MLAVFGGVAVTSAFGTSGHLDDETALRLLTQSGQSLATKQHPGANGERRFENSERHMNSERHKQTREHSGYC